VRLLGRAAELGLRRWASRSTSGRQTKRADMWAGVLDEMALIWAREGGGACALASQHRRRVPGLLRRGDRRADGVCGPGDGARDRALRAVARVMAEPGRGLVAEAGVIACEVMLVSRKSDRDMHRWVYLDIGKFSGLAETMDEAIRYQFVTPRDGDAMGPCIMAGPSCDSGRRALREAARDAAHVAQGRRPGADPEHRGLHVELFLGGLQRVPAARRRRDVMAAEGALPPLRAPRAFTPGIFPGRWTRGAARRYTTVRR
jgi:hypothetical protein